MAGNSKRGNGYGALLKSPGVARLVPGMVLARLPVGATTVLLVLFVSLSYGAFFAGLTTAAMTLGTAIAAPFLGRLVDRGHGPAALILASVSQLLLVSALVLCVSLSLGASISIALAFAAGICTPPVAGTTRSLRPDIVSRELLNTAYNFEVFLIDVLYVTGPLLASAFIAAGIPQAGLVTVMAGQFVGSFILARSNAVRCRAATQHSAGQDTTDSPDCADDGKQEAGLLGDLRIALLLLVCLTTNAFSGALETVLPLWYSSIGSANGSGLAISLWSAGSIIGVLAFARFQPDRYRFYLPKQLCWTTFVYFIATLSLAGHEISWLLLCSVIAIGLTVSPCTNLHYQLSGSLAPRSKHAEMFSWLNTATSAGISIGAFAAGTVADYAGFQTAFSAGSLFVAAALVLSFALNRHMGAARERRTC